MVKKKQVLHIKPESNAISQEKMIKKTQKAAQKFQEHEGKKEKVVYNAYSILKYLFKKKGNELVGRHSSEENFQVRIPRVKTEVSKLIFQK